VLTEDARKVYRGRRVGQGCPRLSYQNKTKSEDSAKLGNYSEHQKVKGYSTQQRGNLNNSLAPKKKNYNIQALLQGLTPRDSTDYSMWKETKKIKQITKSSPPLRKPQGTWARNNADKAHAFTKHLVQVFQP
jgi:hypothetical protein